MRLLIGLILALAFASSACDSDENGEAPKRDVEVAPAATVQAVDVKQGALKVRRDYGGEFVANAMADLSTEVSGTVTDVRVRLGDRVEVDDILAVIDPLSYQQRVRELEASVALSKASVEEARAQRANLEAELKRKRPLLDRKLVTEREIENLESQVSVANQRIDVAQATVRQNQARLDTGRDNLKDTNVRAPFAGIVAERFVDLGNHVNPGQALFRVVDDGEIYLRLRIAEHDSGMIRQGMPVSIRVDALGGQRIAGEIGRIAPAVDSQTRTLRVDVVRPENEVLDERETELWARVKPGMFARAQIIIADRSDAISVPTQALHKERDGSFYVWVVNDSAATKQTVTSGLRDREVTEIVDGLTGDEVIVVRGHEKLEEGIEVKRVGTGLPQKNASDSSAESP